MRRTFSSASSLTKRNIVRIQRQTFEYSASRRILRGETALKLKGNPLNTKKFSKKCLSAEKNERGDPVVSSGFVALQHLKSKKLKVGPFALSFRWPDLASVILVVSVKSGPISVRSVVYRIKRNKRRTSKVGAISKAQKAQSFVTHSKHLFMKSSENSFETPKVCLSCSIRLGNYFFPNWKQKKKHLKKCFGFFSENVA